MSIHRLTALLLPALFLPALLGSCALLNDPRSSFNAGQTWIVTGQDGPISLRTVARTGLFSDAIATDRTKLFWQDRPVPKLTTNQTGLFAARILFPNTAPVITREPQSGETMIVWNAGQPGALYTCLIRDGGPPRTHVYGDLIRSYLQQDTPLGQCEAVLQD